MASVKKTSDIKTGKRSSQKQRFIKVSLYLNIPADHTIKKFTVTDATLDTTVKQFSNITELVTGVPVYLQRLHYLDDGELFDEKTLAAYDIVPGAVIKLTVFAIWETLIAAAVAGNINEVFKLGVTNNADYDAPRIAYMKRIEDKQQSLAERAAVALFIASCHGYVELCSKLIEAVTCERGQVIRNFVRLLIGLNVLQASNMYSLQGADVNWKTPKTRRSPLHAAAAMGQANVVDKLLAKGADVKAVDADGNTAITLANKYGHKICERHLVQFTWQQRALSSKNRLPVPPLLPHQRFDSALPASLIDGPEAQVYRPQLIPPGEFEGTAFDSPRRKVKTPGTKSGDASRSESRGTSATLSNNQLQQQCVFYDYQPPSNWLAMTSADQDVVGSSSDAAAGASTRPLTTATDEAQSLQQMHGRRQYTNELPPDLVAIVIARKMQEQQEKGLAGLPYDLWLSIGDHSELFQALKHRGQLNSVLPE